MYAEYLEAWHNYWDDISTGLNSYDAIGNMRADFGGVARKQPIPEINGIYNEKMDISKRPLRMFNMFSGK